MPIRVLHILNNLGSGGVEGLLMNLFRAIDKKTVIFDFLIRSSEGNRFIDEIEALGGRVYIMPSFPRQAIQNFFSTNQFFKEHREYKIIHVHANSLIYTLPLLLSKKQGIPCRIIHSHSTDCYGGSIGRFVHHINRLMLPRWATDFFACSNAAGEWMFGKHGYHILNNGINLKSNQFNEPIRHLIRSYLNLKDDFVIGHVGRFLPVKNHSFIIEVLNALSKKITNCKLLLIGEGEPSASVKEKISKYHLESRIIYAGVVPNVNEYLSSMDTFIFPSLYEGLPLSLIEAQANGLPCFISDRIPKDVIMNSNVKALRLSEPAETWATTIEKCHSRLSIESFNPKLAQYDVNATAEWLCNFYTEQYKP